MPWYDTAYVYDIGVAQFVAFPRPLYPPDDPDGPVKDGPDVEAVKRAVSRLGRWPWPTDPDGAPFDQAYSNAFAHGRSANAGDSGVEGVQRQAKIAKPSGAIGERTYDVLLYARIPAGLPHAGDFAMDDRAIALLKEAEKMFNKPNSAPPATDIRDAILDHLDKRLGYTENPADSNCDTRPDGIRTSQDMTAGGDTWLRNQPWCGCWVAYAYINSASSALIPRLPRWPRSRTPRAPVRSVGAGGRPTAQRCNRVTPLLSAATASTLRPCAAFRAPTP